MLKARNSSLRAQTTPLGARDKMRRAGNAAPEACYSVTVSPSRLRLTCRKQAMLHNIEALMNLKKLFIITALFIV
jgi:hypothetical protein